MGDTLVLVDLYTMSSSLELSRPVLIVGFDGWVNAGGAATRVTDFLAAGGVEVAHFDSDALFDYRDTRPTVRFSGGVPQGIDHPAVTLTLSPIREREILVLTGQEPSLAWKRLGDAVTEISNRLGVIEQISVGGIPWAAPHTRPVTIITTASSEERLGTGAERPEGNLAVPASATSAVEQALIGSGLPTVGFWARVPNYIGNTFHAAAVALLDRISEHLGIAIDTSGLAAEAAEQRIQLDAIAEGRADVRTLVTRLEALVDEEPPVSGEQLASEIERFLRSQDGGTDD